MVEGSGRRGPAPRAVEREARRFLPLLDQPGAEARCVAVADADGESVAVIVGGRAARHARTSIEMIEAFAARDWVERTGDANWRISPGGGAWHRRQVAGEDRFRAQHQECWPREVEMPDGARRSVRSNAQESPLDWLRGRKDGTRGRFLSEAEFEAGERLRRDFTAGLVAPSVTANWEGFHLPRSSRRTRAGPEESTASDGAVAARQRFNRALAAVGPELGGLLVDVCCLLIGLEEAERTRGWPKRSAKVVLRLALDQLARHYGLVPLEDSERRRRNHHWAVPGYRPTIDGGAGAG